MSTPRLRSPGSALLLGLALAACGTTEPTMIPNTGTILPNATVKISPSISYTVEQIALAGAAGALLYVIYDPLAPNWRIEESRLSDDTYAFSLRAKSFRVGGDGEAMQVVKRRAQQLQFERGYAGYRILEYTEGIESATPLTYRVSAGTVQLVKAPPVVAPR